MKPKAVYERRASPRAGSTLQENRALQRRDALKKEFRTSLGKLLVCTLLILAGLIVLLMVESFARSPGAVAGVGAANVALLFLLLFAFRAASRRFWLFDFPRYAVGQARGGIAVTDLRRGDFDWDGPLDTSKVAAHLDAVTGFSSAAPRATKESGERLSKMASRARRGRVAAYLGAFVAVVIGGLLLYQRFNPALAFSLMGGGLIAGFAGVLFARARIISVWCDWYRKGPGLHRERGGQE